MRIYFPRQRVALEVEDGCASHKPADRENEGWRVTSVLPWQMDDAEQFDCIMRTLVADWQQAMAANV